MRICLLIPDGVGIRNYLYSDLIKILQDKGHQIVLWHSLDPEMIRIAEERIGNSFEQFTFTHRPDGMGVQLLREAARFARIRLNADLKKNPSILTNWTGAASSFKGKLLNKSAEFLGSLLRSYSAVAEVESLEYKLVRMSSEFQDAMTLLKQINPDLLFCTHQRVFSVTAAIEAAKSLGIATSTAVFSWDNLPKGRLPFRVDQYLVWSEHMKSEMMAYYPEINPDQIKITGSPQFDFYSQKGIVVDREEFGKSYGLDPDKEWICFSGCDTVTSPNDPNYLADVAKSLEGNAKFQLIFRPVPVEPVDRFNPVLETYPDIHLLSPRWVKGNHWGNFFPLFEDIRLLVNLAYHCKVVINMGSTMALDFSTFGNVGLYLRYDHLNGKSGWSVNTIYQFEHFRSMGDWQAVGYIYSPEEIKAQIERACEFPNSVAPDRQLWFNKIVQPDIEKSAASRVAEALLSKTLNLN